MLKVKIKIENGQLRGAGISGLIPLPPEVAKGGNRKLTHPYYWSVFTLIGSPW